MFARSKRKKQDPTDENPFVLSFSDLMAGLLAIFILALIVTMLELQKRKEELRMTKEELVQNLREIETIQSKINGAMGGIVQHEQSLKNMLQKIQVRLGERKVEVQVAENGTVLRIQETGLTFSKNSFRIEPQFEIKAQAIGEELLAELDKESNRQMLDTVFIEGHTDALKKQDEMGNWGLSAYRAISLWNFWTLPLGGKLSRLKELHNIPSNSGHRPQPLISVSGYADTRSTHPPEIAASMSSDRAEDRRIDIRFTLAATEKKKLEDLQKNLKAAESKMGSLILKLKESDKDAP
jgi:flagellar motor protein MotB